MDKTKNSKSASEGKSIHVPFMFETGFHPPIEEPKVEQIVKEEVKNIKEIKEETVSEEKPKRRGRPKKVDNSK